MHTDACSSGYQIKLQLASNAQFAFQSKGTKVIILALP